MHSYAADCLALTSKFVPPICDLCFAVDGETSYRHYHPHKPSVSHAQPPFLISFPLLASMVISYHPGRESTNTAFNPLNCTPNFYALLQHSKYACTSGTLLFVYKKTDMYLSLILLLHIFFLRLNRSVFRHDPIYWNIKRFSRRSHQQHLFSTNSRCHKLCMRQISVIISSTVS